MRTLNVGIVGCGGIANNKHLPAMKRVGNFNIVAFCDLIEERAVKAKEDFGTPDARIYTDYQELVREDLDAVYVLTPNSAHAPVAIAAMKAGKHVLCEKPMAKTFAEAQEMVRTAKETGRILTIGYQNRYRGDSQYLKKACTNGRILHSTLSLISTSPWACIWIRQTAGSGWQTESRGTSLSAGMQGCLKAVPETRPSRCALHWAA